MSEYGYVKGDCPDVQQYGQLDDWGMAKEVTIETLSAQLKAGEVGYVYEIRLIPVAKVTGVGVKVEDLDW